MKIAGHDVKIMNKDSVKVGCKLVSRAEIRELLEAMDGYTPLAVGEFVVVIECKDVKSLEGKIGKIVRHSVTDDPNCWGVEFMTNSNCCHSLNGCTKNGHGFWFAEHELELTD